jgi:hypothetical protein
VSSFSKTQSVWTSVFPPSGFSSKSQELTNIAMWTVH